MDKQKIDNKAGLIWSIADKLQGDYKPHEYGDVILPFTVLKRFDSVLADTKAKVLKVAGEYKTITPPIDKLLKNVAKQEIYNVSDFDFKKLLADPDNIKKNFKKYITGFSDDVKDILSKERGFEFDRQIDKLDNAGLLYLIIQEFNTDNADLHPDKISNIEMGYIFEEIIRRFSETYNADAGEFYTPREIIQLMVNLLLDNEELSEQNKVISIYDGACGTGGMLSIAYEHIKALNSTNEVFSSGQEINPQTYAICKSDMLLKGGKNSSIKFGSTLSNDQFPEEHFDYIIMNPPFGREWKKDKTEVEKEHKRGKGGRFGAGLPAIDDSQLLFLQNAVAKMKPNDKKSNGSKVAIIHNASALYQGDPEKGGSEIRRYILENDLLDTIIQLPTNIFYNTPLTTYIWLLSNKKPKERIGKVQLINASEIYEKRRRSLGKKMKDISPTQIDSIVEMYNNFKDNKNCKIFDIADFAYRKVVVNQPQLNEDGKPMTDKKGKIVFNKELEDTEIISFKEDINDYMKREVLPYCPHGAFIDESKIKIGYEIPFTKHFYKYQPLRKSAEIMSEILELDSQLDNALKELANDK
ncbi:MAG: type I restriction-modification system subunit M [Firmicutes bacterium]|nr:type I restriction-modification system subunit M [Bacillota bacterium]